MTDDEARKNWEKYGNPDGPGAMSFGIALPSWIVEKKNSVWVLGLYALVFMVALPTAVGMWWYKSIRYTGDQVLLATTQVYWGLYSMTSTTALKRCLMILAASYEFCKGANQEIIERQSDNDEVPSLIKKLPNLGEKNKETPLCHLYSIKARAIIHAHLSRIPLNPDTLEKDRQYIIKKCPYLIQEMIMCVNQLILLAYTGRVPRLPTIHTIENCMKLSPMIVQGFWQFTNPLLQLPHIEEEHLKYFLAKKRKIKSLQQLAQLKGDERRQILRSFNDDEYDNIMKVLGNMPFIDFKVQSEVIDDDNPTVYTAEAIVTVTVTLIRKNMRELFGDETIKENINDDDDEGNSGKSGNGNGNVNDDNNETVTNTNDEQNTLNKKSSNAPWLKQKRGTKKLNKKGKQKTGKKVITPKLIGNKVMNNNNNKIDDDKNDDITKDKTDSSDSDGESEKSDDDNVVEEKKEDTTPEDDDAEWDKFQQRIAKREKVLGRSNVSHKVHCPLYPDVKQEYWWVYICDRKSHTLLTSPVHVTSLIDIEEVQLRFTAPTWPGVYTFSVCLRSDSYLGFYQTQDIKVCIYLFYYYYYFLCF